MKKILSHSCGPQAALNIITTLRGRDPAQWRITDKEKIRKGNQRKNKGRVINRVSYPDWIIKNYPATEAGLTLRAYHLMSKALDRSHPTPKNRARRTEEWQNEARALGFAEKRKHAIKPEHFETIGSPLADHMPQIIAALDDGDTQTLPDNEQKAWTIVCGTCTETFRTRKAVLAASLLGESRSEDRCPLHQILDLLRALPEYTDGLIPE